MILQRKPVSIQTKWTLRYTAALLLSVTLCAVYAYNRIDRDLAEDVELLLELQMREMLREVASHPGDDAWLQAYADTHVVQGEEGVKLGIAVIGPDGKVRVARGFPPGRLPPLPSALGGGAPERAYYDAELGGRYPYRIIATRSPEGILLIGIHTRRFVRDARHLARNFALALGVVTALTAVLGYLLARGSLRPIAAITATARRISAANVDERIPTTGSGDELDQLAATLNDMIARLHQSMDRMRQFSADAAHELRTPLAALRSQIEVTLEKDRMPDEYRAVLGGLVEEVERLGDAVSGMLRLASSEAGIEPTRRENVPLVPLLDEVVDFFAPVAEEGNIELSREACPDVVLSGDPTWLHQLFANLVHNALKYTAAGGRVTIDAATEGGQVWVRVRDTGVGVAPAEQERIFARFHRSGARQDVPGAGLGLPIAREIARAHGGEIELTSAPGSGSSFTVRLPVGRVEGG